MKTIKSYRTNLDGILEVAVLVAPGYGAGWSTWAMPEYADFMRFDAALVHARQDGKDENAVRDILIREIGEDNIPYTGGWSDVQIQWIPVGERFRITESDGHEHLTMFNPDNYITA